ncbi:MAG: TlpA family protein disulfide reductase, partial [Anaerolineales bacterium]
EDTATSRRTALLFVGAGLLFGLLAGLVIFYGLPAWQALAGNTTGNGDPVATSAPAPVVGAPAPEFVLKDLSGNTVRLSDYAGKPVLINFWATWCGPCRAEMPAIEDRYKTYASSNFVVLAVNVDEPADLVSPYVKELGLTFPILLDTGASVTELYRVLGFPTSYWVDGKGVIVAQHTGPMFEDQLNNYLAKVGIGGLP